MRLSIARAALAAPALGVLSLALSAGLALAQGTAQGTAKPAAPSSSPAAGAPAAAGPDVVVATVNGVDIHRSDIEAARQDLPAQYQSYPIEVIYRPLLDRVIDGLLMTAAGRKAGLQNDPEVKTRLEHSEDQIIRSVYIAHELKARLTDAVLQQRYQEYLKANPPEPEISVRQILFKTEDEAKEAIKQLQGGADFAELAKKHAGAGAADQGGDLGYIKKGDVVPEFAEAAFKLKVGQYTDMPVKTQFGWHVIKVEAIRTSKPPSFEEAKAQITQDASRDLIGDIIKGLQGQAKIARFNIDGTPMKEDEDTGKAAAPEAKPAEKKP
jgi:peptidyl-prolyl cis-trans isomerase C